MNWKRALYSAKQKFGDMFYSKEAMVTMFLKYKGHEYTVALNVYISNDLVKYSSIYRIDPLSKDIEVQMGQNELRALLQDHMPFRSKDESLRQYLAKLDIDLLSLGKSEM